MDHDPSLVQGRWTVLRTNEWSRLHAAVWARAYELLLPPARRPVDRGALDQRDQSRAGSERVVALEIGG